MGKSFTKGAVIGAVFLAGGFAWVLLGSGASQPDVVERPEVVDLGQSLWKATLAQATQASTSADTDLFAASPSAKPVEASSPDWALEDIPESPFKQELLQLDPAARAKALQQFNELKIPLLDSASLHVGQDGSLHYACSGVHGFDKSESVFLEFSPQASESLVQAASIPASQPPAYNSKPDAPYVIYLDFNGGIVSGTLWNSNYNSGADYDTYVWTKDTDETTFSDDEQAVIREIWQRIAEDYAPFNINISTDPAYDPDVTGGSNSIGWILFTRDEDRNGASMPAKGAGGVAWINVFGNSTYASTYSPAFVYADNLGPNVGHFMAEAGSHEMGHNMGLSHDGSSTVEYYSGHGTGETEWAPIMGSPYYKNVTTWSKGEYLNANNTQDDLSIIAGKIGTCPDASGDTPATATPLSLSGDSIQPATTNDFTGDDPNEGLIESPTDKDFFSFDTSGGTLSIAVNPFVSPVTQLARGNNLDLKLTLYDSAGGIVATDDPAASVAASLNLSIAAGSYALSIEGTGAGTPLADPATGYTSYGSLGRYFISGTIPQNLTVASPGIGAVWQPGKTYPIVWGGTGTGESVDLDLYLNGVLYSNIISGINGADSSFSWTVPYVQPLSSGYTIRLTVDGNSAGAATSEPFMIAEIYPEIIAQAPPLGTGTGGPQSQMILTFNDEMDPLSFSIQNDVVGFTGPQGVNLYSTLTGFTWSNANTVLTISFNAQSEPGFYRLILSPEILDTNANPLDQNRNLAAGEAWEDRYEALFEIIAEASGGLKTLYSADMSSNPGTTQDPGWAWGVPSQGFLGGPNSGYTGGAVLGCNLSGPYAPNILSHATLPAISTVGANQIQLQFRRWLGIALSDTGAPSGRHADYASIHYSTNGTTWTQIWATSTELIDTDWSLQTFSLPPAADNQPILFIRFTIDSDDQAESFGWNIDDILVTATIDSMIEPAPPPVITSHTLLEQGPLATSCLYVEFSQPMNAASFSLADIASFSGPGGSIAPSGFLWGTDTVLRIDFPRQTIAGTYTLLLNPTIEDQHGRLLDQDLDLLAGEAVDDQYAATFSISGASALSDAESWRVTYFETTDNTGDAADDVDYDRDGLVNVLERAFGTIPTDGASAYRPSQSVVEVAGSAYLSFEYDRLAGGTGSAGIDYVAGELAYVVEYSDSPGTGWSSGAITVLSISEAVDGMQTVRIRLNTPLNPGARQFIRLSVNPVP